jgi:hypothetical protein
MKSRFLNFGSGDDKKLPESDPVVVGLSTHIPLRISHPFFPFFVQLFFRATHPLIRVAPCKRTSPKGYASIGFGNDTMVIRWRKPKGSAVSLDFELNGEHGRSGRSFLSLAPRGLDRTYLDQQPLWPKLCVVQWVPLLLCGIRHVPKRARDHVGLVSSVKASASALWTKPVDNNYVGHQAIPSLYHIDPLVVGHRSSSIAPSKPLPAHI